jgi:hypothetical protein
MQKKLIFVQAAMEVMNRYCAKHEFVWGCISSAKSHEYVSDVVRDLNLMLMEEDDEVSEPISRSA